MVTVRFLIFHDDRAGGGARALSMHIRAHLHRDKDLVPLHFMGRFGIAERGPFYHGFSRTLV
jgi:hypothetical protein